MVVLLTAALMAAPDVFFVSVDTLRADHLGCYGYPLATSPNIDALAEQSLVFDDVVCEVPLTAPSFCSMFTSQFPRVTGTTRNGLRLPENIPTVAEQFDAGGYHTVCVQSNWTLKRDLSGLDRGFDVYEDDFHKRRWGLIKSERDAREVTDIALRAIEARKPATPLFAWIHYSDPHAPYKHHRQFDPRNHARDAAAETPHRDASSRAKRRVTTKYDSEVAYTDHHIGRLLGKIPADAVVVFVADHGESLYEHDYLGHGRRIYQPGLRIPFSIRAPGVAAGRSDAPIRGIDVGPTLLALAGIPVPDSMIGMSALDPALPAFRPRVVETYGGAVPQLWGAKALMADAPPQLQGVLHEGWKLIISDGEPELFYLPDDPLEVRDQAGENVNRLETLQAMIEEWDSRTATKTAEQADLSDEDRRALDNLGYME